VVDQWPLWVYERDKALFTGGFARLARDGAFARAELPYASTFTACGHAAIGTGAPPAVSGVVGNQWWRRDEAKEQPAEYDPASPVLALGGGPGGRRGDLPPQSVKETGSSRALRVEGTADALRRATGGRAHSVAIALKARAAVFVAGQHPDLAVWYEAAAGGMTTSLAYAPVAPAWLAQLGRDKPADRFLAETWQPRDAALLAHQTGIADDMPGEGGQMGMTAAFPHAVGDPKVLVHTPFADQLVMDAALASLDAMQLGADDVPDLLAVSFNAHDYAGHIWGPDSWEVLDLTLRLDALLGQLFDELDRRLGRTGWAVVLTSDHGATPIVERAKIPGSRRIPPAEIAAAAGGDVFVSSGNIYLTKVPQDLNAIAAKVAEVPNVAAVGQTAPMIGHCDDQEALFRAICLAIVPGEAGELFVIPQRGSLISEYATGTHHDAPFDDNRFVPLFVMAPGLAPQTGTASLLQVAPTVAALLGIPPPDHATERPLFGLH